MTRPTHIMMMLVVMSMLSHLVVCDVVTLGDKTLAAFLAKHKAKPVLVKFYAPWCGHCKKLAPEYIDASQQLEGKAILAELDCTENPEAAKTYDIKGYPTLKLFYKGKVINYEGERVASGIVRYFRKLKTPDVIVVETVEALQEIFSQGDSVFVGFFKSEGEKYRNYASLAKEEKSGPVTYVAAIGIEDLSEFSTYFKAQFPTTLPFGALAVPEYPGQADPSAPAEIYTQSEWGTKALLPWINSNSLPLLGDITHSTADSYYKAGLPIITVYLDDVKDYEAREILTSVAKKYKNEYKFGVKPFEERNPAFEIVTAPFLHFENEETRDQFLTEDNFEITTEKTEEWISLIKNNKAKRYIKSEPIPEKQDLPVYTVVGKTLEEVSMDPTRDVLIEFYATWCGHCKELEPKYMKLGEHFKNNNNVRIARINSPENYVPKSLGVTGFPTIIMFRKGDKKPVTYKGARELDALIKFVEGEKKEL